MVKILAANPEQKGSCASAKARTWEFAVRVAKADCRSEVFPEEGGP
jgi:hypothetical protein